jgi:hypothetical protein
MKISELNTRITIKDYTTTQDNVTHKPVTTLTASWQKSAKVTQTNGSRVLDNAAISYKESYEIFVRYETTRPTLSKYHIAFNNKELVIHSSLPQKIGNISWEQITAFTTN